MALVSLPTELIELISSSLSCQRDMNALARTSRHMHQLLNPRLYQHNVLRDESSALRYAGYRGGADTVRRFLSYNSNRSLLDLAAMKSMLDAAGQCVLDAAIEGYQEVIEFLIDLEGIDLNFRSIYRETPLTEAIRNCHQSTAMFLLDQPSVQRGVRNKYLRTPVLMAADHGCECVVQELLKKTGFASLSRTSHIPFDDALRGSLAGYSDLDDDVVDPTLTDVDGNTAFSCALLQGNLAIVRMFLANREIILTFGQNQSGSALLQAVRGGNSAVVELILKQDGIEPDRQDEYGKTALIWAVWFDNHEIVEMLVRNERVNINSQDRSRRTALSWAAERGNISMVELLVKNGARPDLKDIHGQPPLSYAVTYGNDALLGPLVELEAHSNGGGPANITGNTMSTQASPAKPTETHVRDRSQQSSRELLANDSKSARPIIATQSRNSELLIGSGRRSTGLLAKLKAIGRRLMNPRLWKRSRQTKTRHRKK